MRAGELIYQVFIYNLVKVKDELGSTVQSRVLYKQTRASKKVVNGTESEKNSQLTAVQTVVFKLRYDSGINETMVVEHEGIFYNILFINNYRASATELTCVKLKK